jgi:hypothetical protein
LRRSTAALVLAVLGGALVGSILNDVLSPLIPVLRHSAGGGLSPANLTLPFFSLTFGLTVRLTLGTALGIVAGLAAYRRF